MDLKCHNSAVSAATWTCHPRTWAGKGQGKNQGRMDSSLSRSQVCRGQCPRHNANKYQPVVESWHHLPNQTAQLHHLLGQCCLQGLHPPLQMVRVWTKITFPERHGCFENLDSCSLPPLTSAEGPVGRGHTFIETLCCTSQKLKCPVTRFTILLKSLPQADSLEGKYYFPLVIFNQNNELYYTLCCLW